jgi:hypothetical protein
VNAVIPLVVKGDFYDIHGKKLISGRPSVIKIIAESLSQQQHNEKHVIPTPISRIRVRKCMTGLDLKRATLGVDTPCRLESNQK